MSAHPTMSHPTWKARGARRTPRAGRQLPGVGHALLAPMVRLEVSDLWAEAADSPVRRGAFDPTRLATARRRAASERLIARAAADVVGALGLEGAKLRHVSRVRLLEPPVRGEPLRPLATVRFRSCPSDGTCHLTLRVELRRPGGRALGSFEMGVHVPAARPEGVGDHPGEPAAA